MTTGKVIELHPGQIESPAELEPVQGHVLDLDMPPILPAWAATPELRRQNAARLVRYTGRVIGFYAVRSPKYGARILYWAALGAYKGVHTLVDWIRDAETGPLRAKAVDDGETRTFVMLNQIHGTRTKVRLAITAATGLALAGGAAAAAAATPIALPAAGVAAFVVAARAGKPEDDPGLDPPVMPMRLDLRVEHLDEAFRAAKLLAERGKTPDDQPPSLVPIVMPHKDSNGWAVVFDMPRGGGKTAADALSKRDVIAAELGVDEIQVDMARVRAPAGGHAGRISMWVADDDPYLGASTKSPLETMERFNIWDAIPFGRDARQRPVELNLMWQSMFFGGLQGRGKTASQRIPASAAVLDPNVRHWLADGKGGKDWTAMRSVAHRVVLGAESDACEALGVMLDELIVDMERRFVVLRNLPDSICPDAKLTPEIARAYDMPVTWITIDELQEILAAMDRDDREAVITMLCRLIRRGRGLGLIVNAASQRPDADSVPTKLRDIITYRWCSQVIDGTSSDMVLGKGKAAQGADASMLSEEHLGVGVLVTGPANHVIVKSDYMDMAAFSGVCARGRRLREEAGTLSGDAIDDVRAVADAYRVTIHPVLSDCLEVMRHLDRIHTIDLLNRLVNLDEDSYGDWDPDRLAAELDRANVVRTGKQVKIDGENRAGYRRADLEAAVPPELLLRPDPYKRRGDDE